MASLNTLAVKLTAICGVCSVVLFFTNTDVAEIKHTQRKKGPQIAAAVGLIADRCYNNNKHTLIQFSTKTAALSDALPSTYKQAFAFYICDRSKLQ